MSGRKLLTVVLLFSSSIVCGDEPTVSYIFPAGGQRGTTVEFRVGGHYLHQHARFEMLGEGVTAVEQLTRASNTIWFEGPVIPLPDSQQKEDYPVDHLGSVQIAEDATTGIRRWRVMTSQGATASLPFVIGDLPEIVEQEIAGQPIPTPVELPVTINGRTFPREDIDIWTFTARAGETYVCEVLAGRMGSPLDASLQVLNSEGQVLGISDDALGTDPRIVFTALNDGPCAIHIWDANNGGLQHYVYRLTLTEGSPPEGVFPLGGRRGETLNLDLIGHKLANGSAKVSIPPDAPQRLRVPGIPNVWLETSDLPELNEQEPNNQVDAAQPGTIDSVWNGRIQSPKDIDVWRMDVAKGKPIHFDLRASQLGSPLDGVITITDAMGTKLAESDDRSASQVDPELTFDPKDSGTVYVHVSERFTRRGATHFAYRLHVRSAEAIQATFRLNIPADALTVLRGGEVKFKVTAERLHRFKGPIGLSVEGLPDGVTFTPDSIPEKKNDATLVFKATDSASIGSFRVILRGQGERDGIQIEQVASTTPLSPDDRVPDHLLLAVAVPTPFKVFGDFETKYAARGSTYVRHFQIDRGDYAGPLTVSLAERQVRHLQGVSGPVIEIPAGTDEFEYPIHLPPWMEIGRTSRTCVMAVADVTLEDGSLHTVSATSHAQNDQIIVLVDPGQLSLRLERPSWLARPGDTIEVPFVVERGAELQGPIEVSLVIADHVQGVHCEPMSLSADQSRGALELRFADSNLGPFNQSAIVRARATQSGQPYTAETALELVPATGASSR